jgi:hypothetical protein
MVHVVRYYLLPAFVASVLFALPYGMLVPVGELVWELRIDWTLRLAAAATGLGLMSIAPFGFFLVARVCWSRRALIVRERLYGLPLGIAAVAAGGLFFVLSDTGAIGVLLAFMYTIGIAGFGFVSAVAWETLGYPTSRTQS